MQLPSSTAANTRTTGTAGGTASTDAAGFAGDGAPPRGASETLLLRQARDGNQAAFAEIVRLYQRPVYRQAWRILRNEADAEDAAQETFLRAWRSLHTLEESRGFRPWILRIATNTAITHWNRRNAPPEVALDDGHHEVPDPGLPTASESLENREELRRAEAALAELPPENMALVQLRYGEELSIKEIARMLNRTPNSIAVTLHRLRERVAGLLIDSAKDDAS